MIFYIVNGAVCLAAAGLVIMALRPSPTQPLYRFERAYLIVSGLPALMTLVLPATFVGELVGERDRLVVLGAALSFLLFPVGGVTLWLRHERTRSVDPRLAAALLFASAPLAVVVLYAFG